MLMYFCFGFYTFCSSRNEILITLEFFLFYSFRMRIIVLTGTERFEHANVFSLVYFCHGKLNKFIHVFEIFDAVW